MSEQRHFTEQCNLARRTIDALTITSVADAAEAGEYLDAVTALYKAVGAAKKATEAKLCEWAKEGNVKRCDIGGDMALVFSAPQKYKINKDEICKRYGLPEHFTELLASEPFKIGAIKATLELSQVDGRTDVSDCFEVVDPDGKVEIKPSIVDKRFLGASATAMKKLNEENR